MGLWDMWEFLPSLEKETLPAGRKCCKLTGPGHLSRAHRYQCQRCVSMLDLKKKIVLKYILHNN